MEAEWEGGGLRTTDNLLTTMFMRAVRAAGVRDRLADLHTLTVSCVRIVRTVSSSSAADTAVNAFGTVAEGRGRATGKLANEELHNPAERHDGGGWGEGDQGGGGRVGEAGQSIGRGESHITRGGGGLLDDLEHAAPMSNQDGINAQQQEATTTHRADCRPNQKNPGWPPS
jgi:hypothetical protein